MCKFYAFFMKMLTRALRSIWSPWRNKKGATATNPKMMPRHHSGDPTTHRDVHAKESVGERVMQDGGVIPISGFPQVSGTAKEGHRKERFDHGANEASHSTHAFGPRTASRGYTFEACVFEANRFGGEVVVHMP